MGCEPGNVSGWVPCDALHRGVVHLRAPGEVRALESRAPREVREGLDLGRGEVVAVAHFQRLHLGGCFLGAIDVPRQRWCWELGMA